MAVDRCTGESISWFSGTASGGAVLAGHRVGASGRGQAAAPASPAEGTAPVGPCTQQGGASGRVRVKNHAASQGLERS